MYKERLKDLRENFEFTQTDIANKIGIAKARYCQYENEYDIIPLKHLLTIGNIYHVSLDYLFGFTLKQKYDKYNDVDKKLISNRLKDIRKENKLTQNDLADILHTTQSVIAGYETGRYLIATPFLYTICKDYHISADYLLGKIDYPKYFN